MKIPLLLAMPGEHVLPFLERPRGMRTGAQDAGDGDFVVVLNVPSMPPPGQRYLFRHGRRGSTADDDSPVRCEGAAVGVRTAGDRTATWQPLPITATDTKFESVLTMMKGQLLEPAGRRDQREDGRTVIQLINVASGKQVPLPKLPAGEIAAEFIEALAEMKVAPHVAPNTSGRRSAVPDTVAASPGMRSHRKSASGSSRGLAGPGR